jgi:hypothetical protein
VAEGQGLPVAVTRAGQAIIASLQMNLQTGDLVYLGATWEEIQEMRRRLNLPKEA